MTKDMTYRSCQENNTKIYIIIEIEMKKVFLVGDAGKYVGRAEGSAVGCFQAPEEHCLAVGLRVSLFSGLSWSLRGHGPSALGRALDVECRSLGGENVKER